MYRGVMSQNQFVSLLRPKHWPEYFVYSFLCARSPSCVFIYGFRTFIPRLLFTITLTCIYTQGTQDIDESIDPGLALVPGPQQIIVQRKTPVLLNCSLNITDETLRPISYTWLKDGEEIDIGDRPRSKNQLFQNGSLYLRARKNKARNRKLDGVYDCVVKTKQGTLIARRVRVGVASIGRNFSLEPSQQEVAVGSVARFACSIRAKPKASYVWHKNDFQLSQDNERLTFLPSGILQISDVDLSDAGFYWCQATPYLYTVDDKITNFDWKTSRRAELKVKIDSSGRPLRLLAPPQNISVVAGEDAVFECLADGNPKPAVTWKKKGPGFARGTEQSIDAKKLYGSGNLLLTQVTPDDEGTYECTVSSPDGQLVKTAMLTVLEPPKVEQGPGSYQYPVSKAMSTQCLVSGNPTPKISWYHNGKPMKQSTLSFEFQQDGEKLLLYTLQKTHSGFYQCMAENEVGQVTAVALLRIVQQKNAPQTPRNVKCIAMNSTSISVTWEHNLIGNGVHPYVIAYQVVGDTTPPTQQFCRQRNGTFQGCPITKLSPYTNYSVTIQAYTTQGASDATEKVYVQTLEDVPSDVLMLNVTSPLFNTMLVSWTPLSHQRSHGRVIAYRVYYRLAGRIDETSIEIPPDQTSYLITGVEPEKRYEILVIASTSAGYTRRENWKWFEYTTPPRSASSPPQLGIKYINMTAVLLEWQAPVKSSVVPTDQTVLGYDLELQRMDGLEELGKLTTLEASVLSHTLTNLENDQLYEVTLVARTAHGASSPRTQTFRISDLREQLVPGDFKAKSVGRDEVTLVWAAVPSVSVEYEVCFRKELENTDEQCQISKGTSLTISNLEAFSRYEFYVRALMEGYSGTFSENLVVQTTEDKPSPPLNLTVEVLSPGTVQVYWLPPLQSHGVITSYVLMYGRKVDGADSIKWKNITRKDASAKLEDLETGRYYFQVTASNKAGQGKPSELQTAVPKCEISASASCRPEQPIEGEMEIKEPIETKKVNGGLTNMEIGIIIGCIICVLIIVVIILLVFLCRQRCRMNLRPVQSHSPIYRGNGHIAPQTHGQVGHHRPGNGHVHLLSSTPGGVGHGHAETINLHESTPMLQQIPENEQSDTKGAPDLIMPNGLRPNGVIKGNHKLVGHTIPAHPTGDLNSSNTSEELQGLMAAMLASAEGSDTLGSTSVEKIPLSSLDGIDRDDDELGDQSSEDSGTGCRRAGMLGSGHVIHGAGTSLASSPGGSSLDPHQQGWEGDRQVDEIGGVFIDRSTGAVIGEVSPRAKAGSKKGSREERSAQERTCEDTAANDRDSGHGSEARSHGGIINGTGDTSNTSSCVNCDVPASSLPSDGQVESRVAVSSLPLPPPPPPPSLLMSSSPTQSSSSTPSSQQLPCSSSRNLPTTSGPQHNHRHHARGTRQHMSPTDLPPPPPPPSLSSPTQPPLQGSLAAVTATTTSAAAATTELNSSSSIDEGGQQRSNDSGSILSRQLEGKVAVSFSPSLPPPSPPHIA